LNYINVSPSADVRTAACVADGRELILEASRVENAFIPLIVIFVSILYELHSLEIFGAVFLNYV
jgi:hypothetical protein